MRLIDADKYTENMKNFADSIREGKPKFAAVYDEIINSINRQPTAYDVDKVLKQLEEAKSMVPVNRVLDDITKDKPKELGQLIAYDKSIKIVKAGGIQ